MRTIALALCSLTTFWFAGAQKCTPADHNEWLAHAISEVETIHPGMTRAECSSQRAGSFRGTDFRVPMFTVTVYTLGLTFDSQRNPIKG
jgi:hypothetical protein